MCSKVVATLSESKPSESTCFNPFHATGLFLYPLKTLENQRFSDNYRGYRKRPVASKRLKIYNFLDDNFFFSKIQISVFSVPKVNWVSYGEKSLRFYGPKIWNSLPLHVKTSENLKTFKDIIKNWNGSTCNCRVCQG